MDSADEESLLPVNLVQIDHVQLIVLDILQVGDHVQYLADQEHNTILLYKQLLLSLDEIVVRVYIEQRMDEVLVSLVTMELVL
jgi:hypothetical protein